MNEGRTETTLPLRPSAIELDGACVPTKRNLKIIDILRQVEYVKKQLKQLLDT